LDFYLNVCDFDSFLVPRLLSQLNNFYPDSKVIIISDGPLEQKPNFEYVESEHLKEKTKIHLFIRRNFELALKNSLSPYIVKIDPDTYFNRKLSIDNNNLGDVSAKFVTHVDPYFGRLPLVCSSFIIYSRESLENILAFKKLDSPIYSFTDKEDIVLSHLFKILDFKTLNLSDKINTRLLPNQEFALETWDIVHPVKFIV
jgi:hypothetical protein